MIILRQKEFGNKENKSAKRNQILEEGKPSAEYERASEAVRDAEIKAEQAAIRKGKERLGYDEYPGQKVHIGDRYRNGKKTELFKNYEDLSDRAKGAGYVNSNRKDQYNLSGKNRLERKIIKTRAKLKHLPYGDEKDSMKKKLNRLEFINDHKGAVIAGTLGGAALVGGSAYLIHRHNKKKKEAENKKNQDK